MSIKQLLDLNNEKFIVEIYRYLLERDPDPSGISYYTNRLLLGYSKYEIIKQISKSDEFLKLKNKEKISEIKKLKKDSFFYNIILRPIVKELRINRQDLLILINKMDALQVSYSNINYGPSLKAEDLDYRKKCEEIDIDCQRFHIFKLRVKVGLNDLGLPLLGVEPEKLAEVIRNVIIDDRIIDPFISYFGEIKR